MNFLLLNGNSPLGYIAAIMFSVSYAYALPQFIFPYLCFMQIVTPQKQIVLKSSAF